MTLFDIIDKHWGDISAMFVVLVMAVVFLALMICP